MLFCLLIFSKLFFAKKNFRNTIRVSNSLDPDQADVLLGHDLGSNCLQKLSADDHRRIFPKCHQSVKQIEYRSG